MLRINFPLNVLILILLLLALFMPVNAQHDNHSAVVETQSAAWFVTANIGTQMSGIKSEDFVGSNYSPLVNVTAGRWFVPYMGLQIGYKGHYFNYIGDDFRHHYNFFYGEALFNVHQLLQPQNKIWNLIIHAGAGYFHNHHYGRPNICANAGIQQQFRIVDNVHLLWDVSAIMGWDIYQGDEDILPGTSFGLSYSF